MAIIDQLWKGYFSYLLEDQNGKLFEDRTSYVMKLDFNNGSFTGTTVDEETKELFTDPITVKGFIEGKFINFIVQYPHNYYFDEESNQYIIEYEEDYPGCEYTGEYDEVDCKYFGEWRIIIEENKTGLFQDTYTEQSYTGYWEMKSER